MTHNRIFHLLCGILAVLCPVLILASCSSASASSGSTKKSSTSQAEKKKRYVPIRQMSICPRPQEPPYWEQSP